MVNTLSPVVIDRIMACKDVHVLELINMLLVIAKGPCRYDDVKDFEMEGMVILGYSGRPSGISRVLTRESGRHESQNLEKV